MSESSTHPLQELGFTAMESAIYAALLRHGPGTGYAIAKAIGKPPANVYKSVRSLAAKGAIQADSGGGQSWRPVPVDERMEALEARFAARSAKARAALVQLQRPSADIGVYNLEDEQQVLARARRMLASAQSVALLDLFPGPLEQLRDPIEEAAGRGVAIGVKAYAPAELCGVRVVVERGQDTLGFFPGGQWLNVVVDSQEMLVSVLRDQGEVVQAIWSESPFLAMAFQSGLVHELLFTELLGSVPAEQRSEPLEAAIIKLEGLFSDQQPGYQRVHSLLTGATPCT